MKAFTLKEVQKEINDPKALCRYRQRLLYLSILGWYKNGLV